MSLKNVAISDSEIYLSIATTILNTLYTIYKVNKIYSSKWSMSALSTWLLCLLGNTRDTLRGFGYYTDDWIRNVSPGKKALKLPDHFLLPSKTAAERKARAIMAVTAADYLMQEGIAQEAPFDYEFEHKQSLFYTFHRLEEAHTAGSIFKATVDAGRNKQIVLQNCAHFRSAGAELLAIYASSNMSPQARSVVRKIDLSHNDIGNSGAKALAETFVLFSGLQTIYLDGNSINNEGAVYIASRLLDWSKLEKLSIRDNSLGNVGALQLVKAAATHPNAIQLKLSGNPHMTDTGQLQSIWDEINTKYTAGSKGLLVLESY